MSKKGAAALLVELEGLRTEALEIVGLAHGNLQEAKKSYESAVVIAHAYGCSNTAIATAAERSETAIRLFLKRRQTK